jgi:hypothetical protein
MNPFSSFWKRQTTVKQGFAFMKNRTFCWLIGCVLLCCAAFLAGRFSSSNRDPTVMTSGAGVITYSVDGIPTSFNRAWPTYGLPLTEYTRILMMLRTNQVEELIPKIETLLDFAVYDTRCRYALLNGKESLQLAKALQGVSDYRQRFPRSLDDSSSESWLKKEKEVNAFLLQFGSNNKNQTTNGVPSKQ